MLIQTDSSPGLTQRRRLSQFAVVLGFSVVGVVSAVLWARFSTEGSPLQPVGGVHPATEFDSDHTTTTDLAANGAVLKLTEQQRRGKQIYLTGISPSGDKMTAVLGNSSTEVPAAVLTCVNCHRHDGRGKPEGGIYPSNIRWDELTKPYGVNLPHGRTRPPYDESLLKRSIAMGLGPAGKPLDNAMPRYRMTHQDLTDLVAYLMVIGRELDPGLSADRIRIGVILAPRDLFPNLNLAVEAVLNAYIFDLNQNGGVYQRQIELCFAESPARLEDRAEAAIDFVNREQVFALASSFIAGAEGELSRQLEQAGVPLVGAQTLYPQLDFPLNRHVFYVGSGLHGQSRALIRFANDRPADEGRQTALLFPKDATHSDQNADAARPGGVVHTIEAGCASMGWQLHKHAIAPREFRPGLLAQRLARQKTDVVFSLLSAEQNLELLQNAAACDWFPACYLPGDIAGRQLFEAPQGFDQRIFLSFSSLPSQHPGGIHEYNALAQQYKLPASQMAAQFAALAELKTLIQGLQQAGARLSRERLIEHLETLYEYRTGFAPPVTFGPNRRVGARGAYVVTIDLTNRKLVPVSNWVDGSSISLSEL